MDTQVVILDNSSNNPVIGLAGKIVKETKLKRKQVLTAYHQLKEDESELDSAPSSLFLLVLNNHRLLLCKEMIGAPTLANFLTLSRFCLGKAHSSFIQAKIDDSSLEQSDDIEGLQKLMRLDTPSPLLRITPLLDEEELSEYIERFSIIRKIAIKLLKTNAEEIDNDDFWKDLQSNMVEVNGETAKIEFSRKNESLNKTIIKNQIANAGCYANSDISISGFDAQGDKLSGNNDEFVLKAEVNNLSRSVDNGAKQLYSKFVEMMTKKIVVLPMETPETLVKIKYLFDHYRK